MRNIILLFTILIVTGSSLKAQEPAHDAVYENLVSEYTLHHDGSYDLRFRKELKLLTHFSFHRLFGETFILYDPGYQQVKVNEAYTLMADGRKVEVPDNAFNELLPRFAVEAPLYNRMRELVITHTGLETGATLYLDYTVHTTGEFLPFFMEMLKLREPVPVRNREVIVSVPEDIPLKYNTFNLRTSPQTYSREDRTVYHWSFKELPPDPRKPLLPSDTEPCLAFTIARDMEWAFFRIVNQEAFRHRLGPALESRVETLVKKDLDDISRMKELQRWVIEELKTVVVPAELNPYRARTPEEAWASGYATPLEKAILLSDLLIKAGINAFPAYIFPARYYDDQVGVPLLADRVMVQVNPRKNDQYYLSVRRVNDRNDLYILGNDYIFPIDGARETLRAQTVKKITSELLMEGAMSLDSSGAVTGNLDLTLEGYALPYLALAADDQALKRELAGSVSPNEVSGITMHKLSEFRAQASVKLDDQDAATLYGEHLRLSLPEFRNGTGSFHLDVISAEREVPVALPFLLHEIYELKVQLPAGYRLVNNPGEVEIRNSVAELRTVLAVRGNEVILRRSVNWLKDRIEVPELVQLRDILDAWYDARYREIYLAR